MGISAEDITVLAPLEILKTDDRIFSGSGSVLLTCYGKICMYTACCIFICQKIFSLSTVENIVSTVAFHRIVPGGSDNIFDLMKCIVSRTACQIGTQTHINTVCIAEIRSIVSKSAEKLVVACAAFEYIVALVTVQLIVTRIT